MEHSDKITIIDFGSQYTQLIARRIREQEVYSEIVTPETPVSDILQGNPKGIILSGGPQSVKDSTIPFDPSILDTDIPVLGICYGMQLLNHVNGGTVEEKEIGEYGKQTLSIQVDAPLFSSLDSEQTVWMSHRDSVSELAPCFHPIAHSSNGHLAAIQHKEKPQFALQFHPEVNHTEHGRTILQNFLDLCRCQATWKMDDYISALESDIRKKVGTRQVLSLVSGGVDSTVATLLCCRAIGEDNVHALYFDTGLMRAGETESVKEMFEEQGMTHLHVVDAGKRFLSALEGVTEPEEKRKRIGNLFVEIMEEEIPKIGLDLDNTYLCQGTLYTDLIESGLGCGKNAAVIKSHHNVNPPFIAEKREKGHLVEPNSEVFKDEVRAIGELLEIPPKMLWRHPFPGPGLAIRIMGEITKERLDTLRQADAIYLEEIQKAGLYNEIWQAFAVLIPIATVGVMGDQRTEGQVIGLRAVTSNDGMTAACYAFPPEVLQNISTRIVNEVAGVNRVVYDITSKPPGTIEWE
ncbi:MAG: glutamine-hydrolyzing GMP synthase [Waddliaceae bacterium]|nr:glutamine-hydrolyzing GMP synthase [Waddliaceae bacterium]